MQRPPGTGQDGAARPRSGSNPGGGPAAAAAGRRAAASSSGGGAPPSGQAAAGYRNTSSPSPAGGLSPELSQDLEGMNPGGPDSSFAGHELYRALRGSQGDDPLTDELLWDGDFLTSQREFIQKKQEEQLLERLERRMGRVRATPKSDMPAPQVDAADDSAKAAAAGTEAAAAGGDGVVEVNALAARKASVKAAEEQAKQQKEALERLDTAQRLEVEAEHAEYSYIRRTAIKICTHSDFELIVLLMIFGNCISLAAYDPVNHDGPRNAMLAKIDLALNIAFTVEMVLRILSIGGVLAYLRHPWNSFDCVMVLAGYTTFIPMDASSSGGGLEGLKALRALRAMRPLRTITRFPALRSIVVCFLEAMPLLVSVAAMLLFFLFIFAVAGTELLDEAFHYGCRDPATGEAEWANLDGVQDEFGCGARQCPAEFSECYKFDKSTAREMAGFDNVGLAMISVFQSMTLSNWSFTMYRTMDFLSPVIVIYWLAMIIFGAYFVLNLFLAVLKTKFAKAQSLLHEKRRHRRALKGEQGRAKQNILMKAAGWARGQVKGFMAARANKDALASHINEVVAKKAAAIEMGEFDTPRSNITGFTEFVAGVQASAASAPAAGVAWVTVAPAADAAPQPLAASVGAAASRPSAAALASNSAKPVLERQMSKSSMGSGMSGYSGYTGVTGVTGTSGMSGTSQCLLSIEEFDESVEDLPAAKRYAMMLQYRIRVLVTSSMFNNIFLLAIIANTVALALTHEGMTHEFEEGLHQANLAFTILFTVEMLAKIAGLGLFAYLSDAWSLFDALVVAFSLVEMVTELMARSNASGLTALRSVRSLRVLRSFRVLRVMKMFKYLDSLKMIAAVLMSCMSSFASIVVLLVLFWLVFSIMGLHVFGGLKLDEPWPNHDDLINALIMNFNTLNLENFQTQMYSAIRATNYASSAFWLAWVIMGKYILLMLFLAVTLDAFERKYEADIKKGVRSQSMASSMFSRLKGAGKKLRGMASSIAGSGSGKSAFGGVWGGGSKSKDGCSGVGSGKAAAGAKASAAGGDAVQHDAIAAFRPTAEEAPGAQRRSTTEHQRRSVDGGKQGSQQPYHRRRSSEAAGTNGVSWGAPTELSPRTAAAAGSPSGVRAQPGILVTPREGEQQGSGSGGSPPRQQRRVTLFTESMRQRGESPEPGTKSIYNHQHTAAAAGRKSGGLTQPDAAEELLDLLGGAPAGSSTAAGRIYGGAQDVLGAAVPGSSAADMLLLAGMGSSCVEPSITAKAIKRRKAAGASDAASSAADTMGAESSAASESRSQGGAAAGGGARQLTRSASMGSEAALSDGGQSYISGGQGSQSGAWSVGNSSRRSRTYPDMAGTSLWLFKDDNAFRLHLYSIVTARWFDYVMFFFIVLNCVAMAYEYPHMSRDNLDGAILFWSDMVFTICFAIEALMKVVAFGFKPYISFFQNQVDFTIVVTSLVMLALDTMNLEIIKALRVLRAIKPLRALTRSAGMQLIFKSLTLSLAAMGNVSIVVMLFFLIFAILGVQLFHGKFWSCNDTSVAGKDECFGTYITADGLEVARMWSNAPYTFDHLGMAMVSLFITATLNGYTEIMWAAMAAPEEPGLQPKPMNNWSSFFFFAAFVLVVAYTLLNLYIGVVFYQFSRIRLQSQTGSAFLTDDQTEWVELSRLVFRLKPPEKSPVPVNKLRKKLYYFVMSKQFGVGLMVVIIANSALMATVHYNEPHEMIVVVEALNYAFTCMYVLEFLIKLGGLGWEGYWKNSWNKFDLLLLVSSLADMIVALVMGSHASFLKVQKIMRLLRLARVVKLMRSMKGLRSLFGTLIVSLPAFWNVGALLGLLFFVYAYVGMLLLGSVKHNGGLNEHTNFERFWTAALTLFKVATNDNWTDVMVACMIKPPDCDPALGECGSWVVYPYFISFVLIVSIIMLNLFTAVILESFEAQQEQDRWKLRPDHLDEFVDLWAEYDDGSGTIDPKDLEGMLLRLSPPLGLGPGASSTDVLRFVFDLDIPLLAGRVPFQRTAYELVRRCSGAEIPEGMLKDQIDRLVSRAFRNLKADEVLNFSVAVTVMRVQRKWRARMRAAKLKRKREFRAERGVAPAYSDVVAARHGVLKSALQRRQGGDLRWRPNAAYSQQWAAAEAELAAEQAAAAAAAALNRSSSGGMRRSNSSSGEVNADAQHWSSLAHFRASADGWVHRVTDGFQKLKVTSFFSGMAEGAVSGRSWFGSRSSSKAIPSNACSRAVSEAASMATSVATSVASKGGRAAGSDDGCDSCSMAVSTVAAESSGGSEAVQALQSNSRPLSRKR
ncbi:hypothetical protein OEZ86_010635 [Tetradesmus obliquus]|nr:hypothetical protein OEZ86_010635 [Tetradesmus obliquus]